MKPHFLTICLALAAAQMASPGTALAAADSSGRTWKPGTERAN